MTFKLEITMYQQFSGIFFKYRNVTFLKQWWLQQGTGLYKRLLKFRLTLFDIELRVFTRGFGD